MTVEFKAKCECLFMAEDCLLAQLNEGLLWRKQSIKLDESAATQSRRSQWSIYIEIMLGIVVRGG
jgi:hypothetical protein